MKKLSARREARILALYAETHSCSKVGERTGLGSTTVYRVLKRNGVQLVGHDDPAWRMGDRHKLTDKEETEIAKLYADGVLSSTIAQKFSCSPWLVREVVKRRGGAVHERGNRFREFTAAEVDEMARRWIGGEAQTSIALSLGVAQPIVSRVLRAAGHRLETRHAAGAKHGRWTGGRMTTEGGYVMVHLNPQDPLASMRTRIGYVFEHRLVMARHLGRPLSSTETVHHINGDRSDNRIENLQIRRGKHGNGIVMICNHCGSHDIVESKIASSRED